jgi:putative membrane protein
VPLLSGCVGTSGESRLTLLAPPTAQTWPSVCRAAPSAPYPVPVLSALVNLVRGSFIGFAEVVPGVSGGTIALILGLYETLVASAAALVRGILAALRARPEQARAQLAQVHWRVIIPVGVGMAAAVVVGAAVLEPLVEQYPVQTRAVFFGLVVVGVSVPARMVGRWDGRALALAAAGAAVAFVLTGLPPATIDDPTLLLVAFSGAVAVCALALPGVSGSFLLLSMGLYESTIAAVNDRDLGYLAAFALGAAVGLGSFVLVLQWLLSHRPRITLVVLTGLMVGSLRPLWPWQDENRTLLPPDGDLLAAGALALAGAGVILALIWLERRLAAVLPDVEMDEIPADQSSPRSLSE